MTGDEVRMALAALDLADKPHRVARIFEHDVRSVWRWQTDGAPPHIALAFGELLSGRVKERGIKYLLRRIGKSRTDYGRYGTPRPAAASAEADPAPETADSD
jgi:hypothetical protein